MVDQMQKKQELEAIKGLLASLLDEVSARRDSINGQLEEIQLQIGSIEAQVGSLLTFTEAEIEREEKHLQEAV